MATITREVYRCSVCGGMVEVLHPGAVMQCCGKPMERLQGNTTDAAVEKHVPVVQPVSGGYRVMVGSQEHPMHEAHCIEWIELLTSCGVMRCELRPGSKPEATFRTDAQCVQARAWCNLHGLWQTDVK